MSPDELFEALDILVDVRFFTSPFDGLQAVHDHKECVWVPVSLVLLDECLGLGVNGENGLVFPVTGSVVDVSCCCEMAVLK